MSNPFKAIDEARDALHAAGVADAMRSLSRREYFDSDEAMADHPPPPPAGWDDVELHMLGVPTQVAQLRAKVERNRDKWRKVNIDRWLEHADTLEAGWSAHVSSENHEAWLRSGGPARLWDALRVLRDRAHAEAALVDQSKGSCEWLKEAAELHQWRMDEMVSLYLQEAAE